MGGDFSPFLAPGEQIRWSGRPAQGLVLRPSDAMMIPFSLMWFGFAIFWETSVLSIGRAPTFFALWGIPFIVIGLYISVGRFFGDAWARSRTYYALTDRRALVVSGMFESKLTSVELSTLTELRYKPGSSGRGTIVFGPDSPYSGFGSGWGRRYAA